MDNINYKNIDTVIYIGEKIDSNKKIVLLKRYNVDFIFSDGNYNIWVNTNYIINAENETIAMKESSAIEEKISKYIKVYYYT